MNAINKNDVSMFKVGDFVVRTKKSTKPILWKIIGISNVFKDSFVCNNENETLVHHFESCELRHATSQEIAAGHRIDKSPLLQHLDKCEEVVKTWPKWKLQSVLDALDIPVLDNSIGNDSHIENHVSPLCKVTEAHVDEALKLNRLG